MTDTLQEKLTRQLRDSVERLQRQADYVEFWAAAVSGCAQPVPDYKPDEIALAGYMKPAGTPRNGRRDAANQNRKRGG